MPDPDPATHTRMRTDTNARRTMQLYRRTTKRIMISTIKNNIWMVVCHVNSCLQVYDCV